MKHSPLQIDHRYQGFPGVALGGIAGGILAPHIGPEAEVILRRPIPTGETLELRGTKDHRTLRIDGTIAAQAGPAPVDLEPPEPVSWTRAANASRSYLGHLAHPFEECFCCGTNGADGDGLRLFAGPIGNGPLLAAPWTPHPAHVDAEGTITVPHIWAAVDYPSIWAVIEASEPETDAHVVTGRLALRHVESIAHGDPHVVTAWPLQRRGDTWPAAAAIFDAAGTLKAVAHHTLVVTDWGVPLGLSRLTTEGSPRS